MKFEFLVSTNMEEGGIYDLYCSQPPGGDQNVLTVVHL